MNNAPFINQKRALSLMKSGAKLIDVRNPVQYRDSHIDGSENMSMRQLSQLIRLPRNTPLIFRGESAQDGDLTLAVKHAFLYGFTSVFTINGGEGWK